MKVAILGGGEVGYEIAKQLSFEGHDVSVVENDKNILKKISSALDVKPIFGNATDVDILKEAELDNADTLIAVTSSDEVNLVACQIASFMFNVKNKIVRLSNKSYLENRSLFDKNKFDVNFIVFPKVELSSVIKKGISTSGVIDNIPCLDDRIRVIGIECPKKSVFTSVPIKFMQNITNNIKFVVLFIERNGVSFIPKKNDILMENDKMYFAIKKEDQNDIIKLLKNSDIPPPNLVFVGGGSITKEIASSISQENPDASIKIIEKDIENAKKIFEILDNVEILHGDSLDYEILNKSFLENTDVVISTTKDDKVNILTCLLAKKYGAKRVAAMVANVANIPILHSLGINTILDPKKVVVSKILHYMRGGDIESIFTFSENLLEIFTIKVSDESHSIGAIIEDISSKNNIFVAALLRGKEVFIFPKRMVIIAGDKLLLVIRKAVAHKITTLFEDMPEYLL